MRQTSSRPPRVTDASSHFLQLEGRAVLVSAAEGRWGNHKVIHPPLRLSVWSTHHCLQLVLQCKFQAVLVAVDELSLLGGTGLPLGDGPHGVNHNWKAKVGCCSKQPPKPPSLSCSQIWVREKHRLFTTTTPPLMEQSQIDFVVSFKYFYKLANESFKIIRSVSYEGGCFPLPNPQPFILL